MNIYVHIVYYVYYVSKFAVIQFLLKYTVQLSEELNALRFENSRLTEDSKETKLKVRSKLYLAI